MDGLYTDISSVVIDYMQYNKPYVTYVPEWETENFKDIQSVNVSQFGHEYNHLMSNLNTLLEKEVSYTETYKYYIENNNLGFVIEKLMKETIKVSPQR